MCMSKKKILLICHYSNEELRNHIDQTPLKRANLFRRFLGRPDVPNIDAAPWISTFIDGIKKYGEDLELHVMSSCVGMKYIYQDYSIDDVAYHIFNYDLPILYKATDKLFNIVQRLDYRIYRKRMSKIIERVKPDLIVLSGAENPEYSWSVLDHLEIPTFVILQTLLSSPRRIRLNVGTPYRRKIEQQIFANCQFFTFSEDGAYDVIKSLNKKAICFDFEFSTLPPPIYEGIKKQFDFVFVSGSLNKFKGIEDTIKAFGIFSKCHPNSTLDVIGFCWPDYQKYLDELVIESGVYGKVFFEGRFQEKNDMFKQVQKSKILVVPGITATLNTTVREGMFVGMPTIQYETSASLKINKKNFCLLAAKMEDFEDLAKKMIYLYENPEYACQMARNGMEYANNNFTTDAVGKMLVEQIYKVFKYIDNNE